MNEDRFGWTEGSPLVVLWRDLDPPTALEDRVVRELRRRGFLRSARLWKGRRFFGAAVLVCVLFAAGVWLGESRSPRSLPKTPSHILFLEEGRSSTSSPAEESRRIAEYKAWARGLAARGRLSSGEKLAAGAELVSPESGGSDIGAARNAGAASLGGYFAIVARDDAEALEIARSCPHVRHGGRVVIRRIQPV
jgi:hypothetical protein